jgi:orotate phosphoribosyltransferase
MHYRSIADLDRCIVENCSRIPREVGLVVGIPRSGLLAANILALHLNLPFTDLDGFLAGRVLGMGPRGSSSMRHADSGDPKAILLIDDSISSGSQMQRARELISKKGYSGKVIFGVVYSTSEAINKVDIAFEICPLPRVFEWNVLHCIILEHSCMDIDGVLCRDPVPEENDDGPKYENFIKNVEPFLIPSYSVAALVTCRLERYRGQTEEWLKKHGVKYEKLIMMDYPDKTARQAAGRHAAFKAEVYKNSGQQLFIESSHDQAVSIANFSQRPVFCVETREMLLPSAVFIVKAIPDKVVRAAKRRIKLVSEHIKSKMSYWLHW